MKAGTPGFVAARLTEAREARGLSKTALAECIGVTRQTITNYENATHTPERKALLDLADHLNVPPTFFLSPATHRERNTIFWRSLASATKSSRTRALRRYEWLKDIADYLNQFVVLPDENVPDYSLQGDDLLALSEVEIEALADRTRLYWGLGKGPISDVVLLLENNGTIVCRDELRANKLDAFSEWSLSDKRPYVVLSSDKASAARSRFDAAHELAHLALHRSIPRSEVSPKKKFKLIEEQANRFAAAFLLPAEAFASDFQAVDLNVFLLLKEKWRVSVALMIHRCRDLEILSEEGYKRMWIQYARKGWRKAEPLDDLLKPEEPRLISRAIRLLVSENIRTKTDIRHDLNLDPRAIEQLCNLPRGFLDEGHANIRVLPRIKDEITEQSRTTNIHSING